MITRFHFIILILFLLIGYFWPKSTSDNKSLNNDQIELVEPVIKTLPIKSSINKEQQNSQEEKNLQKEDTKNIIGKKSDALTIKRSVNEVIDMFSYPPPEMNEANKDKYRRYLESLNSDPEKSLKEFDTKLKQLGPDNDADRITTLNFINKLNLDPSTKKEFFHTYLKEINIQTKQDVLDDYSLSALVAIDFLSHNIRSETEARAAISDIIDQKNPVIRNNLLDRFTTYFPELVKEFR